MQNIDKLLTEHYNRGLERTRKGDLEGAIAEFSEIIRLNPQFAEAYIERSNVYQARGDFDRALVDATQAIHLDATSAEAYYVRAGVRRLKQDVQGAVIDYTEAIRLNPNHANAYALRGAALASLQRLDEAIADYSEALRLNPKHADVYFKRGLAHTQLHNVTAAVADFREAVRLDPRHPEIDLMQESLRRVSRPNALDTATWAAASSSAPSSAPVPGRGDNPAKRQTHLPEVRGQRERVVSPFTQENLASVPPVPPVYPVVPAPTDSVDEFLQRGMARYERGDIQGAIADFTEVIRLDMRCVDAYVNRGAIFHQQGDAERAVDDFRHALQLDPNHADAPMMYDMIEAASRPVEPKVESAKASWPGWTEYENGIARLADNDPKGALKYLDQAIHIEPKEQEFYSARGMAYQECGDLKSALLDFDKAVRLAPKLAVVYLDRGNARALKEDYKAAIADYTDGLKRDPEPDMKIHLLLGRGKARAESGDHKGAVTDYSEIIQLSPATGEAYGRRGLSRLVQKDIDGAQADYDRGMTVQPGQRELTHLILAIEKARNEKKRR